MKKANPDSEHGATYHRFHTYCRVCNAERVYDYARFYRKTKRAKKRAEANAQWKREGQKEKRCKNCLRLLPLHHYKLIKKPEGVWIPMKCKRCVLQESNRRRWLSTKAYWYQGMRDLQRLKEEEVNKHMFVRAKTLAEAG